MTPAKSLILRRPRRDVSQTTVRRALNGPLSGQVEGPWPIPADGASLSGSPFRKAGLHAARRHRDDRAPVTSATWWLSSDCPSLLSTQSGVAHWSSPTGTAAKYRCQVSPYRPRPSTCRSPSQPSSLWASCGGDTSFRDAPACPRPLHTQPS